MEGVAFKQGDSALIQNDSIQTKSSICLVEYKSQYGIGVFLCLEYPDCIWHSLFITSFQVAPIKYVNELTDLKLFFVDNTIKDLKFISSWVNILWFSLPEELNVTVLEININANIPPYISYLSSATPQVQDILSVYRFLPLNVGSTKCELNVSTGSIVSIYDNTIEY